MTLIEDILRAVSIGLVVASFLLNTGLAIKAIGVCKECLIILNTKVLKMKDEIFNLSSMGIYRTIFRAYCLIPDHSEALIYGRKLLEIYRQCGKKKKEEGNLTISLANLYRQQCRYLEAKELYDKAINISKDIEDRNIEAYVNEGVGIMFHHHGDYEKAKTYLEKALAITTQTGNKKGKVSSYGNLGNVFYSLGQYDQERKYFEKAIAIAIKNW